MRVNTKNSIETANSVHDRFGSWKAAKASSDFKDGKFVVRSSNGQFHPAKVTAEPAAKKA
jgi:hypothetical protein